MQKRENNSNWQGRTLIARFDLANWALSIVFIFMALATLAPTTPVHAATTFGTTFSMPPNNLGLVGWWTFDGKNLTSTTATDSSGQGNTGTLVGGPTPTIGKIGQALSFNGTSQYVSVGSSTSLTLTSAITISAWVLFSDKTNGGTIVGSINNVGGSASQYFFVDHNGGSQDGICIYRTLNGVRASFCDMYSSNALSLEVWHHVVYTYDGSTESIYLDGIKKSSESASGLFATGGGFYPITFAYDSSGGSDHFSRESLDDVRIYNRALSASEVQALYTQGSGSHFASSPAVDPTATSGLSYGLVGYWPLDGKYTNISTTSDISGHGNDGTLVSSPTPIIGQIGQALSFNGTNQYVGISNFGSIGVGFSGTISFYAKGTGVVVGNERTSGIYPGDGAVVINANGSLTYYVDSNRNAPYDYTLTNTTTADVSKWNFYVLNLNVPSSSGVLSGTLYVNGVPQTLSNSSYVVDGGGSGGSGWISYPNADIGRWHNYTYGDTYFIGSVDDLHLYNRALSATEVQQLYAQGSGSHVATSPTVYTGATSGLSYGLVGYWPFDGKYLTSTTATDISGQGNNGTLVGSPTPSIGKIGQALSFDGTSQNILATTTSAILQGSYTISAWYKKNAVGGTGMLFFAGKYGGTDTQIYFGYLLGASKFTFGLYNETNNINYASAPNDTGWHQVVGSRDASGTLNLYIDGVLVSTNGPVGAFVGTNNLYIAVIASNTNRFSGIIDDVRVYNRALSASEVQQLYKQGGGQ